MILSSSFRSSRVCFVRYYNLNSLSMAESSSSPGEKRSLENNRERSEEKKKNNEDSTERETKTTPPKSPSSSPSSSPNKVKSRGIMSGFGALRRAFSTAPNKDKEFWENLPLEEKRKHYRCGKNYITLNNIQTWPEFFRDKKVTPTNDSPKYPFNETLNDKVSLFQGDITKLEIDAIVNAANSSLMGGGGVDGAIHSAASVSLRDECSLLNGCNTGNTKITTGHRLPAKHILHTVGPFNGSEKLLKSCYDTCYGLVEENKLRSVAFCCIATGVYGFPNEEAAHIALDTTRKWLEEQDNYERIDRIIFVVFLKLDLKIYSQLMQCYFPLEAVKDTPTPSDKASDTGVIVTDTVASDPTPSNIDTPPTDNIRPDTPPIEYSGSDATNELSDKPNLVKSVTAPPTTMAPPTNNAPPTTSVPDEKEIINDEMPNCEPMEEMDEENEEKDEENNEKDKENKEKDEENKEKDEENKEKDEENKEKDDNVMETN